MAIRIDTIFEPGFRDGLIAAAKWVDRLVTAALTAVFESRQRMAERHLLATLDDRMLRDLGLSRCDVEHEIRKRFWQE